MTSPRSEPSSRCILVVEDDKDTRDAIVEVLTQEGYSVLEASNGAQALEALGAASVLPSLILMDLMMPVLDGWGTKRRLERDPAWAAIPVVVMTADGNAQDRARSMGAAGSLRKPITLDALIQVARHYCP